MEVMDTEYSSIFRDIQLVSDIQDYFENILKIYEKFSYNPLIQIDINEIENRITFMIKPGIILDS